MPQCPRCNTEIDHLVKVNHYYHEFDVRLINGYLDLDHHTHREDEYGFPIWACPGCDGDLFDGESSVIAFLKGEMD